MAVPHWVRGRGSVLASGHLERGRHLGVAQPAQQQGRHAGVAMYPGGKYAVCDANGGRQVAMEALLEGSPGD